MAITTVDLIICHMVAMIEQDGLLDWVVLVCEKRAAHVDHQKENEYGQ